MRGLFGCGKSPTRCARFSRVVLADSSCQSRHFNGGNSANAYANLKTSTQFPRIPVRARISRLNLCLFSGHNRYVTSELGMCVSVMHTSVVSVYYGTFIMIKVRRIA